MRYKEEGAEYLSHIEKEVALRTFERHGTSCCLQLDAAASILILQPSRRCIHDVQAPVAVEFPALITVCSLQYTPLFLVLLLS